MRAGGASGLGATLAALQLLLLAPAAFAERSEVGAGGQQPFAAAARIELEGRALERDRPERAIELYLEAAKLFELAAGIPSPAAAPLWRAARATWMAGDTLPLEGEESLRLERFAHAETLAKRGLDRDPDCAECMLWLFSSMGRLRTTRSLWAGIRQVPEMAALLDRAVALEPSYADDEENSTLGNLHYTSAIFYRVMPDWRILGWILGVRGDKERALRHIETALSRHPARLDYRVELGSQLVCLGSSKRDPERLTRGRVVLEKALEREARSQDDARELAAARIMLARPERACGYSGDKFLEFEPGDARRAVRARGLPAQ